MNSLPSPSGRPRLQRVAAVAGFGLWLATALAGAQPSEVPRTDFWVTDGPVRSVVETNGVLYVGGAFEYVSPVSETGNAFDRVSGALEPGFPKFAGAIRTLVSDLAGGWFVGGLFTSVDGFPITNLAHVRMDKTVDPTWTPNPNAEVRALVTGSAFLYVGGAFSSIGGQNRSRLSALEPLTGRAVPAWRADVTGFSAYAVTSLALSPAADRLFVGGHFITIGGSNRVHVGSVSAQTGQVDSWHPNGNSGATDLSGIEAMAQLDGVLYVGGNFTGLGGQIGSGIPNLPRRRVGALDTGKNMPESVLPWDPDANGVVLSLAVSCDRVFAGGTFTSIGGTNRSRLAALDLSFGRAMPWDPGANSAVTGLLPVGNVVYVGGRFTEIGGQPRSFLAAVDVDTAQPTPWRPLADYGVSGLSLGGGVLISGGALGPGGQSRRNLAAFDVRTARLLDWNPIIGGATTNSTAAAESVNALVATSNTVYFGGAFTRVNRQTRNRLAAVDAVTGALTAWDPNAGSIVEALALSPSSVYAGGFFVSMRNQERRYLAALTLDTGELTPWKPSPNDPVSAILVTPGTIFIGGRFQSVDGVDSRRLAALDAINGAVVASDPQINSSVNTLVVDRGRLYLGGLFTSIGGTTVNLAGAFEGNLDRLSCWNPGINNAGNAGEVRALAADGGVVYMGGTFASVGLQPRRNLAAVETNCPGLANPWAPVVEGGVNALRASRGSLVAGGSFQNVAGLYRPNLAVFAPIGAPGIAVHPLDVRTNVGQTVVLTAQATGIEPLIYQWQRNGVDLPGANGASLVIPSVQVAQAGIYSLVVINALGLINSRPAAVVVVEPLMLLAQPNSQNVSPGATVTLSVIATSSPPPTYQWRLNGVNIPGATQPTLTIANAQPVDGGSYNAVVASVGQATNSAIANVRIDSPLLDFNDAMSAAGAIVGASGIGRGNNSSATDEPGEPQHVGKPGGRSVWVRWTAPASGIATFSTRGSAFDTLLAIYENSADGLVLVAEDEDAAGFVTSQALFNTVIGRTYFIAVDGLGSGLGSLGGIGEIVLGWSLDTNTVPFPRLLSQPIAQTVTNETPMVQFNVMVAQSATPLSFQWYHECRAILGATNSNLVLTSIRPADVGRYYVEVRNASSQVARSFDASLELGPESRAISHDKLEDLLATVDFNRGGGVDGFVPSGSGSGFISVAAGNIASQTLNNLTSERQQFEPNHCNVVGCASEWLGLEAKSNGVLILDTIGSTFDTVMAVYPGTNLLYRFQTLIACDDNSAPDGLRSQVQFAAIRGARYNVVVDGVNCAKGDIRINWRMGMLVPEPGLAAPRFVAPGASVTLIANGGSAYPPPSYQWFWNGVPILGATQAIFSLTNVELSQSGLYSVLVSNLMNSVMQPNTRLAVEPWRLRGPDRIAGGGLELRVEGPPGAPFALQFTTNLTADGPWMSILTNQLPSTQEPFRYLETNRLGVRQRFYRTETR